MLLLATLILKQYNFMSKIKNSLKLILKANRWGRY